MPLPNRSEIEHLYQYGPDSDNLQSTRIPNSVVNTSRSPQNLYFDVIDDTFGIFLELDPYTTVNQVIIQNLDDLHYLEVTYDDAVTAYTVIVDIPPGEFMAFCRPVPITGIQLLCADAAEDVSAHVYIVGEGP